MNWLIGALIFASTFGCATHSNSSRPSSHRTVAQQASPPDLLLFSNFITDYADIGWPPGAYISIGNAPDTQLQITFVTNCGQKSCFRFDYNLKRPRPINSDGYSLAIQQESSKNIKLFIITPTGEQIEAGRGIIFQKIEPNKGNYMVNSIGGEQATSPGKLIFKVEFLSNLKVEILEPGAFNIQIVQ